MATGTGTGTYHQNCSTLQAGSQRQVRELMMSATPGVFITMDEANVSVIHALLTGPEGTPYEGSFFHFRLESEAPPSRISAC